MGGSTLEDTEMYSGQEIGELPTPIKQGYSLDGWFKSQEYEYRIDAETIMSDSITLYAKWNPIEYDIVYDYGDYLNEFDDNRFDEITSVLKTKITIEEEYTPPRIEVGSKYEFAGWSPSKIDKGNYSNVTFTLVAATKTYTITYHANGGKFENSEDDTTQIELDYGYGDYVNIINITREGYVFGGWYLNSELSGEQVTSNTIVTENMELYAKWIEVEDENSITLTFHSNFNNGNTDNNNEEIS